MDDIWWKLLTILNLLVLAVVVQLVSEIKEFLKEVRKALPTALWSQESLANDMRAIQLSLERADSTVVEKHGLRKLVRSKHVEAQHRGEDAEEAVVPGMPTEADIDFGQQKTTPPTGSDRPLQATSKTDDTASMPRERQPSQEDYWRERRANGLTPSQLTALRNSLPPFVATESGSTTPIKEGTTNPTGKAKMTQRPEHEGAETPCPKSSNNIPGMPSGG